VIVSWTNGLLAIRW